MIAENGRRFLKSLGKADHRMLAEFFRGLEHPFWNFHYTLTRRSAPKPMALVGDSRIADILANVVFPFLLVAGKRNLERIQQIAGATFQSPPRNRRHAAFRRRSAPAALSQNRRTPARLTADLRRLLLAGQLRLRAMSFPRTDAEMEIVKKSRSILGSSRIQYSFWQRW